MALEGELMEGKAPAIRSPRCLFSLALASLIMVSAFVAFSLSGSSPTVKAQRGNPIRTVVLDPADGALVGSTNEAQTIILNPTDGAIISVSYRPQNDHP
jgi:hypothetical protein